MITAIWPVLKRLAEEVEGLTHLTADPVRVNIRSIADRSALLPLALPGIVSPNGGTRLVEAADGWVAVNLPRPADLEAVPAWIGCALDADPWPAVIEGARTRPWRDLVDQARLLGLPVGGVGEVRALDADAPFLEMGSPAQKEDELTIVDLSSLWAGPLCGKLLADAGHKVTKLESAGRPDAMREGSPEFFERLNGEKRHARVDFSSSAGRAELRKRFALADVVITSARVRAFEQLGLTPEHVFKINPSLIWVAISGYGFLGEESDRVAFGDDASAAGGLVSWTPGGEPRFLGDALADPLTGLAAAGCALGAIQAGVSGIVDAAMARVAAGAAAELEIVR